LGSLAKLSECAEYKDTINKAYEYCKNKGLLEEIADISFHRKEIDEWIRFKSNVSQTRIPVSVYLMYLEIKVKEEMLSRKKLKNEPNTKHVALCLYKIMEKNLPEKLETI
jgi:hypothetical protein